MNSNFEWNRHLTNERSLARYREAELNRQVNQRKKTKQGTWQITKLPSKVIALLKKVRSQYWATVTLQLPQP